MGRHFPGLFGHLMIYRHRTLDISYIQLRLLAQMQTQEGHFLEEISKKTKFIRDKSEIHWP